MAILISSGQQLPAGAAGEWWWNNPPTGVAHSFTAEPFCPFDSFGLHSSLASVEITDVIHEQQFVGWNPPPQGQFAGNPVFHNRIRIKIKNTGNQLAGFNLYMSWS
jgi:hypothetical protein